MTSIASIVLTPLFFLSTAHAADWPTEYQAAVAAQSCAEFLRLSGAPGVDVAPLARVRYLQSCAVSRAIPELDAMINSPALLWLNPLASDVIIALAQKSGDKQTLVKYALAHAASLGSQKEKELFLQSAITAAKQIGETASVQAFQAQLYKTSPRLMPSPTSADWMKVGDDFKNNSDTKNAIAYYNKILASKSFGTIAQAKALDGIRQVYKNNFRVGGGSLKTFLAAGLRLASFCDTHLKTDTKLAFADRRVLFDNWLQYPRDEWSYGDESAAKRDMQAGLSKKYFEPVFRAAVYGYLAKVAAGDLAWPTAAADADQATGILQSESKSAWTSWHWNLWDDTYWSAVLAHLKAGDLARALALAQAGLAQTPNAETQLRFRYWVGVSQERLGQTTDANNTLKALMQADSSGFYGFLAHEESGAALDPLPDDDLDHVAKPASVTAADFSLLSHLVAANEYPLAQAYSRQVLKAGSIKVDELLLRGFVRDFRTLWSVSFVHMTPTQRDDVMRTHARLFYPEPYDDIVERTVAHYAHLDSAYVYSIMRQESGFDPFAHSWANAYGLVQILPGNARKMQSKAGVYFKEDYELFDPAVNIALGTAFMDDMYSKMAGSFIMRTMAYNATVSKANEWKQRLFTGDVREFMEEIPYAETQDYVHLVMRNYVMNLRLAAKAPFAFPADLLKM